MKSVREMAVSGSFYTSDKDALADFIDRAVKEARMVHDVEEAASYIVPHAGYIYSGRTAACAYSAMLFNKSIEEIETIVVVGPNHTGEGKPISVSMRDWRTPFGIVANDTALSKLISKAAGMYKDEVAHAREHSVEVQLPFIKRLLPDAMASFVCMGDQSIGAASALSNSVASAAESLGRRILVVASSDFNHYEPRSVADSKDTPLFERISDMDVEGFYTLRERLGESSCGFGPIAVSMLFAKRMYGRSKGLMICRSDSGDQTGDKSSVVDYASFAFVRQG
jgi:AmmeMemoRadiSam system protein B